MNQGNYILDKVPLHIIVKNVRGLLSDELKNLKDKYHAYENMNDYISDLDILDEFIQFVHINKKPLEQLRRQKEYYEVDGKGNNYRINVNDPEYAELKEFLIENKKYLNDMFFYEPDLSGLDLHDANFEGAKFDGGKFNGTDLIAANLNNTVINYVSMEGAKLKSATLLGTEMFRVSFKGANLEKAVFSLSDINHINFENAEMKGAYFTGTKCYNAAVSVNSFEALTRGVKAKKADFFNVYVSGLAEGNKFVNNYDIVSNSKGLSLREKFGSSVANLIKEPFNVSEPSPISRAELKHIMSQQPVLKAA